MSRNNAPPSLNHELNEKRANDQDDLIGCIGPDGNDENSKTECRNHSAASAPSIGEMTKDHAAHHGAAARKRGDCRAVGRAEMPVALQEGWVHVLRAVRCENHCG